MQCRHSTGRHIIATSQGARRRGHIIATSSPRTRVQVKSRPSPCTYYLQVLAGRVHEALRFGQEKLRPFKKCASSKHLQLLHDTLALLAYPDPSQSPVKYLISAEHRQKAARVVNTAILFHLMRTQDAGADPCTHAPPSTSSLVVVMLPVPSSASNTMCTSSGSLRHTPPHTPPHSHAGIHMLAASHQMRGSTGRGSQSPVPPMSCRAPSHTPPPKASQCQASQSLCIFCVPSVCSIGDVLPWSWYLLVLDCSEKSAVCARGMSLAMRRCLLPFVLSLLCVLQACIHHRGMQLRVSRQQCKLTHALGGPGGAL
jgi:hypothetical protein